MEKYLATFIDGHKETTWSASTNMARFRFKDFERLHGQVKQLEKYTKNGLKKVLN